MVQGRAISTTRSSGKRHEGRVSVDRRVHRPASGRSDAPFGNDLSLRPAAELDVNRPFLIATLGLAVGGLAAHSWTRSSKRQRW